MKRFFLCISLILALSQSARAGDIVATGTLEGDETSWDSDRSGYMTLMLDYRRRFWSVSFLSKLGYGSVDERVLEYIDIGARLWHRFGRASVYGRFGLVHQHEIPREAIEAGPFSTIIGVGDGIRHRAGVSVGTGLLVELFRHRRGTVFGTLHAGAAYLFENERGPALYLGGGLGLGFTFDLTRSGVRL